ncbi:TPA: hypothetical protein HA265_08370 [Candidatus Woesearchaeota archaeon]|nr:hypothetical protein [Candidatus Woesearchaeota archaeon]
MTFILACILVYILMSIFTHFVCQMSDSMDNSACRSDFFNAFSKLGYRHLWGPGTWFGGSSGSSSAGWQFWPSTGGGGTGTAGGGTIGPGGAPGPSVGPGGAAAGSGGTTGDGGTASRRDAGWPWYAWLFLILLILGIMGYAGLRVARRVQLVRQQNQRINDLIEELRRLIQSKKNILQQINDPTWTAAQRAADHAALTTLLNNLDASPGILRNRPNTGQINTFFAAQAAPNVFQHYRPLTGQQRQVFINNLIQEKNIQYELGQLLNWWRRWFTNRVAQINGLDARLNNLIFSPKFHADMTVELMFDARPIPQFNQNNMPSVAFVAAVPPGVVNPNLMNFHSPGVYNINLGMVVGGPFDYLYNYSVIGAAGWFQTVDILNPVTNVVGGVTTSRFTVQFNPYDTT